jgi:hypothetical protein
VRPASLRGHAGATILGNFFATGILDREGNGVRRGQAVGVKWSDVLGEIYL